MAKIITKGVQFTGQIGPVRFHNGEGETEVPSMLAHFRRDSDRFDVIEDEQPEHDGPEDDQPEDEDPDDLAPEAEDDVAEDEALQDRDDETAEDDEDHADVYAVNVSELRKLCSKRGLSTAGHKGELQQRLREYDAEHANDEGDNAGE